MTTITGIVNGQDAVKGKALYVTNNCGTCHKIDRQLVGPALGPMVTMGHKEEYLIRWIQNNQALIAKKDPEAMEIYQKFNQQPMPVFTNLADQDVKNILAYVRSEYKTIQEGGRKVPAAPLNKTRAKDESESSLMVYVLLGINFLFFIVILLLSRVITRLERILTGNEKAAS
ncbi:c-type cytochrome [Mucilaginibacter sp. MD40]|uniref:c-type cytochrome n=1 Tax=Mucilaginibacter sp. MD40 TaxID=2029590 RepID=UPI00130428CE|nr:cytochrome c [Mucilaginibacter sp. MD40]